MITLPGRRKRRRENEENEQESEQDSEQESEQESEDEENENESENEERERDDEEKIPAQFRSCSNMLEICNWLVNEKPDILNLAYQMLEAKKPVSSSSSLPNTLNNTNSSNQQVKYIA